MPGVQVTGPLQTTAPATDVYGTHDASFGIDGLRSVATTTVRNAITAERRRFGMMVFCQDTQKYYSLKAGPWSFTDSDWTLLNFGGGTTVQTADFDFPTPTVDWILDHTLGAHPIVITTDSTGVTIEGNVSFPSATRVIVHHDVPGGVAGHATLRTSS